MSILGVVSIILTAFGLFVIAYAPKTAANKNKKLVSQGKDAMSTDEIRRVINYERLMGAMLVATQVLMFGHLWFT